MRRANRGVVGIYLVGQGEPLARSKRGAPPSLLVGLFDAYGPARTVERTQPHDVAREVANQVATGDPRWQQKPLTLRIRVIDLNRYLKYVGPWFGRKNSVANRHACILGNDAPCWCVGLCKIRGFVNVAQHAGILHVNMHGWVAQQHLACARIAAQCR